MKNGLWTRREVLTLSGALALTALGWKGRGEEAARYRETVLAKEPVGYWRLGEAEGPTAHDETKNRHAGVFHGNVAYHQKGAIVDDPNAAIKLDGRDAYVEVPDSAHFSQPTSGKGLSVEVWMRPDLLEFEGQTQDHYVYWLGKGEQNTQEWGMRFYSKNSSRPNRISAYIWNPDGGLGSGAYFQDDVERGRWIHVVACYAPGDQSDPRAGVSIYKNGVLRGSPATQKGALYSGFNVVPAHGGAPLRFGTRDLGSFLNGGMDEIAVYPRALTAEEVLENYRAGSGRG